MPPIYPTELHAVFAVTIYGDRIRVTHYSNWGDAIKLWNYFDTENRVSGTFGIVKYFAVRAWNDPDWNLSRYRSMRTLREASNA